jgi:uncharacterized membrane protein
MIVYLLAVLIGVVAGLRAMMAPAVMAWAARSGALYLGVPWLKFLGNSWVPWLFSVLAVLELISDQLPNTPSRTVPVQFGTRLLSGALCGAAIGSAGGNWIGGAIAGVVGAVIGTLGGRTVRARLATGFGRDRPAALLEDAVAVGGALLVAIALP